MAQKQKKTSVNPKLASLSLVLLLGVVIAGAHLKEVIVHWFNLPAVSTVNSDPTTKKVSSELHNHIEKQTLKSMVKVSGEDVARTDRRHVKHKARGRKIKIRLPHFSLSFSI